MEQLQADLARVGKPLPPFLAADGALNAPSDGPSTVMPVLAYDQWAYGKSVPNKRVNWFEPNLTSTQWLDHPTDVYIGTTSGDADLFVFSPFRYSVTAPSAPQLIGYSVEEEEYDHVGGFYPSDRGVGGS